MAKTMVSLQAFPSIPPSSHFPRAQNSLSFPFQMPATQAIQVFEAQYQKLKSYEIIFLNNLVYYILKQWIVFFCTLIGYSMSEHPALFTDSLPVPPSKRHQTHVSCEQNPFPLCCHNKQKNFTNNHASCS